MSDTNPTNPSQDDAINDALDAATSQAPRRPSQDVPLKRQWDADLDAQLEAAMAGFDPSRFDVATPRTRAADRKHVPKGQRGQEATPGSRTGKVISVRGKSVFIDLGAKSEGVVPVEQFQGELPKPGDVIEVVVDRFDADEGLLILSLKGAAVEATWENLRKGLIVEARVTKTNKGGLEVVVDGIRGFLPIGQIDLARVDDASVYVNQRLRVIVTEANPREKNLVVSRRELLERERAEQREKTWATLEEGQIRPGVVRSLKPYGAFVDLGGVDGLLPVSEISWARIGDPAEVVKVGQEVQVKVLRIDRASSKVSLGLKQLTPSPWDRVEEKYARGMTVKGKVTRLMDFGAFVELEPGIEGLVHISELSPHRVRRVADTVKPEQEVEVRILKIEPEAKKISLSLRPLPVAAAPAEDEADTDEPPAPPKPARKVPLKGGLGDHDPDPLKGRNG
ncbi:MAG: S1 RNA-binding domain-containing protein [Planctomycetaceae bacterium]|nr:S1 RNA-binding domain-containing protein [Planctomycetaceae bacterium]MBV8316845.1 S1 RNA-binding domain-containing protein [Planctomycetaceae bacterium]